MSYGRCERSGQDEEDEICDLTDEQDEEDATSNLEALADLVLREFPDALSEQELFIQISKMLYVPEKTDTQARLLAILELVAPSQLWLELVAPPVFLSRSLARGCHQRDSKFRNF